MWYSQDDLNESDDDSDIDSDSFLAEYILNQSQLYKSPKIIHLFWSGNPLRETEIGNLITFLSHTNPNWTIKIWTDQKDFIEKPLRQYLHPIQKDRIEIIEYHNFVQDTLCEMQSAAASTKMIRNLQTVRNYVQQMSVGLKNPATVKDIFVPIVMWKLGGY